MFLVNINVVDDFFFWIFNNLLWFFNFTSSCSFPFLSVALLNNLKRVSSEKEVERDVDGVDVSWDDDVIIGFKDNMEPDNKYGTQLGIIHVLELVALMPLF